MRKGAVVGTRGRGVVVVVGGEGGRWGREGGEEGGELVGEEGRGEELREEVGGEAVWGVMGGRCLGVCPHLH